MSQRTGLYGYNPPKRTTTANNKAVHSNAGPDKKGAGGVGGNSPPTTKGVSKMSAQAADDRLYGNYGLNHGARA
jgi:hypothetical protein